MLYSTLPMVGTIIFSVACHALINILKFIPPFFYFTSKRDKLILNIDTNCTVFYFQINDFAVSTLILALEENKSLTSLNLEG